MRPGSSVSSSPRTLPPRVQPERSADEGSRAAPGSANGPSSHRADTALLELLSPEERAVYERANAWGGLTYRADGKPADGLPVPTGRRVDLRG